MNKNFFIFLLVAAVVVLGGWIYYLNRTAAEPEPIEEINAKWWSAGHSDVTSEAFVHWNEDEPREVPARCAKCHSAWGFIDYLGFDGTEAMVVDEPAPVESVVSCMVCHNEASDMLSMVKFPSGVELDIGEGNALCAACHSGTRAGGAVTTAAEGFADDEVVPEAGFVTPHYYFAAATWQGSDAHGGFEYPEKNYVGEFEHAEGVQTCTGCHDEHSLRMRNDYGTDADLCAACHSNVTGYADYKEITVDGVDYDGDGNVEGIYLEIEGIREMLHEAMNQYGLQELGDAVGWADQFPYLFIDTNADGEISGDEAAFPNAYATFTPRLMRAAYNYQFSIKDPGAYVHNGDYVLQLLYDSLEDMAEVVDVSTDNLTRPEI